MSEGRDAGFARGRHNRLFREHVWGFASQKMIPFETPLLTIWDMNVF
jgi:hypothetical protein